MPQNKDCYNKISVAPFLTFTKSVALRMLFIWATLVPQLALLLVTKSYSSLLIVMCSVLGVAASQADSFIRVENIRFSIIYSLLLGTLIGFFLPPEYPPASVFFITFIFMFVSKSIFGGFAVSWINPAVLTLACAWFIGHFNFGGFQILGSDLLSKNPSLNLTDAAMLTNGIDEKITLFLNDTTFSLFNVSIPNGYVSLFWDSHAAIPAFRFNFLTLTASVFLIAFELRNAVVPFVYLLIYSLLVRFISPFLTGAMNFSGDILLALLSSGTLFSVFYMLQWPGTIPYTRCGKIFYGIAGGFFAFIFCGTGTSPVGAVMTLFFMNLVSPAIQAAENNAIRKRLSVLLDSKLGEKVND